MLFLLSGCISDIIKDNGVPEELRKKLVISHIDVKGTYTRAWVTDEYGDYMDGQTYGISTYTSYSFDASKYIVVSGSVDRDTAKNDIYANWRYTTGLGFGAEIPWGFSLYLDSSFYWTNYDGERWAVKNHKFTEIAERNFTQRYSISLSNNKIDIWGFVPTFTFSYTKRDSNIHSREYEKWTTEFTMRQRF